MTRLKESNPTECVGHTAKLMDGFNPDWASKIKVADLRLASLESCIMVQLYPSSGWGEKCIEFEKATGYHTQGEFACTSHEAAWKEEIKRRLNKTPVAKTKLNYPCKRRMIGTTLVVMFTSKNVGHVLQSRQQQYRKGCLYQFVSAENSKKWMAA